jgi:hypothetical protein
MSSRFLRIVSCLVLSAFIMTSCAAVVVTESKPAPQEKKVPPGQAKKQTGSQSAKPYAPGQQKKKKN